LIPGGNSGFVIQGSEYAGTDFSRGDTVENLVNDIALTASIAKILGDRSPRTVA